MPFYERRDVTVLRAPDEIAFPMTGDGAVFDLCRSFPNGNGVDDLTFVMPCIPRVPRAANSPLEAKDAESAPFSALHALE